MLLAVRKLMFIHLLHQRSCTQEEYSELLQLLEDVTTCQSDLATKKLCAPKRKDELDRETGLQMQNAGMVTHARKSFYGYIETGKERTKGPCTCNVVDRVGWFSENPSVLKLTHPH